jgi:AcrR family transcriptional regulator
VERTRVKNQQSSQAPPKSLIPVTPRGQRTRRSLIIAARRVFERDGFLNARIIDITAEAGVALGTFYNYFESKEAVFRDTIEDLNAELTGARGNRPPGEDPVAAVYRATYHYLCVYRDNARLMRIWEEVATFDEDVAALLYKGKLVFVGRSEHAIRRLQAQGWADPGLDPRYAAHALTGMVSRFAYAWFAQGESFDLNNAAKQLTRLWTNALGLTTPPVQKSIDPIPAGDGD